MAVWRRGGAPRWGAGGCTGRGGAEAVETILRHVPVLKVLTLETTSHLSSLHAMRESAGAAGAHPVPRVLMHCRGRTGPAPARGQKRAAPCVPPGCERAAVRRPRRRSRSDGGKGAPRCPAAVCPPPTHTEPPALFVRPPASVHTPAPPDPSSCSRARTRPACARARRPPAHAPRLRGLPPARVPPARLHTAARSCTQQADEAPAVAADRSLSVRCRLRGPRPAEPGLFRAKRARGAAGPHAAAPSRPLQPGGQRSHRTTEDRGSRQSASMSARPARPYRRRRARAAAQRRCDLKRRSLTAALRSDAPRAEKVDPLE